MPRGVQHSEEWARIAGMEHNVAIDQTDMFGPSRRFESKGQSSNPSSAGGINRPTKGKGKATRHYNGPAHKSAQAHDKGPRTFGAAKVKGKTSHARKHHGAGG